MRSIALALAGSACVCVSVAGTAKRCYAQNVCVYACVCPLLVRQKVLHTLCVCVHACVCASFVGTAKRCYTQNVCVCVCARARVCVYVCLSVSCEPHGGVC